MNEPNVFCRTGVAGRQETQNFETESRRASLAACCTGHFNAPKSYYASSNTADRAPKSAGAVFTTSTELSNLHRLGTVELCLITMLFRQR